MAAPSDDQSIADHGEGKTRSSGLQLSGDVRKDLQILVSILDAVDQGVAAVDRENRLIAFNRRFAELCHASHGCLRLGMKFVPPAGNRVDSSAATEHRSDDRPILETRTAPLAGGGSVITCEDVTARVAVEQALRDSELRLQDRVHALERAHESLKTLASDLAAARDAAERANRIKSDFLAHMSHELRTPLNAIIGFSDIMMRELFGPMANPAYIQYAKDVYGSGRHLLAIINDILDLSKIESGKLELKIEPVDVPAAVRACIALVQGRADQGGVALDFAAAEVPRLLADELKLKQILLNLLSNAVKFTGEGGRVSVSVALTAGRGMAIEVADTGIGMSEEELAIAILPFSQIESPFRRRHQGTGLGLPLAKSLTEANGGQLELSSERGVGTVARVVFPARCLFG
ncbi:MAG TPA: ATP-binding protein [Stellaceae bacterium]|nr:ATP-binding protein [Stellaceae bacterium]